MRQSYAPDVTRAAAAVATAFALCAEAHAQSLALSYQLDPQGNPHVRSAAPVVDRCAGFSWAASLEALCARIVNARAAATIAESAGADAGSLGGRGASEVYAAGEVAGRGYELPQLGTPPRQSRPVRMAGGKDAYIGSAKSVDVNFRFGSKYRMRSGEDGLEVYKFNDVTRFKDITTEQRSGSGGVKNVGVELLFPFE